MLSDYTHVKNVFRPGIVVFQNRLVTYSSNKLDGLTSAFLPLREG